MTDMISTDMARFHARYDRRNRLLFAAALGASLALSAVNFMRTAGALGAKAAPLMWGLGILFPPLFVVAWWGAMELIARWRDGLPAATNSDDARDGVRIANAGFAYNLALTAAVIGSQAIVALAAYGYSGGAWIGRAAAVAVGAALICLGNVWPRLRTRRARAASEMKINRLWGWVMVILGLLSVLAGLFPSVFPPLAGR
jgi:hypothetical protein